MFNRMPKIAVILIPLGQAGLEAKILSSA